VRAQLSGDANVDIKGIKVLDIDQASKDERIQRIRNGRRILESEVRGDSTVVRAVWVLLDRRRFSGISQ
jgi:hypothetical protein